MVAILLRAPVPEGFGAFVRHGQGEKSIGESVGVCDSLFILMIICYLSGEGYVQETIPPQPEVRIDILSMNTGLIQQSLPGSRSIRASAGIGLRPQHHPWGIQHRPQAAWFEVPAESCMTRGALLPGIQP